MHVICNIITQFSCASSFFLFPSDLLPLFSFPPLPALLNLSQRFVEIALTIIEVPVLVHLSFLCNQNIIHIKLKCRKQYDKPRHNLNLQTYPLKIVDILMNFVLKLYNVAIKFLLKKLHGECYYM